MVFYGSQTGTAEKLALAFARDAKNTYGMTCVVADLDDYDFDDMGRLNEDFAVVFFMATYGEGDATDNALGFEKCLAGLAHTPVDLARLRYTGFGLGSSSYKHFNAMIKRVDSVLESSGAYRLHSIGCGDDGKGSLEDDFLEWKATALPIIAKSLGFQAQKRSYEPTFSVQELSPGNSNVVFDGEPNIAHVIDRIKGPFTVRNPYPAPLKNYRQLFSESSKRSCLHVNFDISASTLTYTTGDHLAMQPVNPDAEVEMFLEVFGLSAKRATIFSVVSNDSTLATPYFAPTTYEAAARHYLDICGPVSRQFLSVIATFASDSESQATIARLGDDAALFSEEVKDKHLSLARLLNAMTPRALWKNVPFSVILENLPCLRPRYYSICSSSLKSKKLISVTAGAEAKYDTDGIRTFTGVNSSYLSSLCTKNQNMIAHKLSGPKSRFTSPTAYISVRRSNFRLPQKTSTPIILIGPGTGVAPFRAFVHERALLSKQNNKIGEIMLFYGCRREDEDFLYKDEWKVSMLKPKGICSQIADISRGLQMSCHQAFFQCSQLSRGTHMPQNTTSKT
jgi:NADPH-ferrihemoprotein reductase